MTEFILTRNRDAWFVIRGYKYQVDLSILRWLSLGEDQEIALEFGEDIDIVNKSLTSSPSEVNRELEQIKHLDRPISLRFPACVIALANAVQHFAANRPLNLAFRFCTNSTVTIERPAIFDDRRSGISVWNALRANSIDDLERPDRLEKILVFLRTSKRPAEGIDDRTWKCFEDFLSSASVNELRKLIDKFEWSTQQPNADDTAHAIMELLQTSRHMTVDQARQTYPRLFLHVMQILSKPSEKRLTTIALKEVIKLPDLPQMDSSLLAFITSELLSQSVRLDHIEDTNRQHADAISELRKILDAKFGAVASPRLSLAIAEITTTLPPQVSLLAKRSRTVGRLKAAFVNTDWMAIYGSVGSGKTQLAALLGQQIAPLIYVSLDNLDADEANLLLHHLFLQLSENKPNGNVTSSGLSALPCGAAIIIDNLPRFMPNDRICGRLLAVAREVRSRSQHLITISHFPIPHEVKSRLDGSRFIEVPVPPFDTHEVVELFERHGAIGGTVTSEIAESFLLATVGNPTLLTAIARSIQLKGWASLGDHRRQAEEHAASGEFVHEAIFRLLGSVESALSRELLYRLCVVVGEFGQEEVAVVSKVAPELVRPLEAFSSLYGLWIEKRSDTLSTVSPLISSVGAEQLAQGVLHGVADSLAECLFEKRLISPIDFVKGLNYLKLAKNGAKLGMHVLKGVETLSELPVPWQKMIYAVTAKEGFLDDCPVPLHLLIKSQQIAIVSKLGSAVLPVHQLACDLMSRAQKEDLWSVFGYAIHAAPIVAEHDFDEGLRLCRVALDSIDDVIAFRNSIADSSEAIDEVFAIGLESALPWFVTAHVSTPERFMKWFSLIVDRPAFRAMRVFNAQLARQGMMILLDRLWMTQHEMPIHRRAFGSILAVYDAVEAYCRQNGLRLFQALAVRSRIIVYAEYLRDLERAARTATSFLASGSNTDEITFVINEVIGRQYLYAKKYDKAIEYLASAADLDTGTFDGLRYRAMLELSKAIGNNDPEKAQFFAEAAVKISQRNSREVSDLDLVVASGEAAVACGFRKEYVQAFDYFDQAYDCIEREFEDTPDWKMRVVILGNALGYFASMAMLGKPPAEDYTVPRRGGLLGYNTLAAKYYDERDYGRFDLSRTLLVAFATSVGRNQRAEYWANKGIDAARDQGVLACIPHLAEALIPGLIEQGRIAEVLDYALDASTAKVASMVALRKSKSMDIRASLDAQLLLGAKPNADWNQVEEYYTFVGLIPTILFLLSERDSGVERLREVERVCRESSEAASAPEKFLSIANAIKDFLAGASNIDLHKKGLFEEEKRHFGSATTHFLLSSFIDASALKDVIVQHAMVLHACFSRVIGSDSPVGCFMTDQVLSYWKQTFKSQRAKFPNPVALEEGIRQVETENQDRKAKALLRSILNGLSVQIPSSLTAVAAWIRV